MVLNELLRDRERLGERRRSIAQVRKFRSRLAEDELAEFCFVSPEQLEAIMDTIDAHPDWDDEQIAESVDLD